MPSCWANCIISTPTTSVVDPFSFDADADPDPAYQLDADPDPGSLRKKLKVFFIIKYLIIFKIFLN